MATVLYIKDNLLLVARALLCQERYGDVSQYSAIKQTAACGDSLPMQLFP